MATTSTMIGRLELRPVQNPREEVMADILAVISDNAGGRSFIQLRVPETNQTSVQNEQGPERTNIQGDSESSATAKETVKAAAAALKKARKELEQLENAKEDVPKEILEAARNAVADAQREHAIASDILKAATSDHQNQNEGEGQGSVSPNPWHGTFNFYDVFQLLRALNSLAALEDGVARFFDRGTMMVVARRPSKRYGLTATISFTRRRDNLRSVFFVAPEAAFKMITQLRSIIRKMPVQFPIVVSPRRGSRYVNASFVRVGDTNLLTGVDGSTIRLGRQDIDWIRYAVNASIMANGHSHNAQRPNGYGVNVNEGIILLPGNIRLRFDRRDMPVISELI